MAEDLLETYLRRLIEAHARSSEVSVAWQGGDPVDVWFRPQVEALPRLGGLQQVGAIRSPNGMEARRIGGSSDPRSPTWSDG